MKKNAVLLSLFVAACYWSTLQSAEIKASTVCSGAATLNKGSIVTLGQPFVGVMNAPGCGVSVSSGLLPALLQEKKASGPLVITPAVSFSSVSRLSPATTTWCWLPPTLASWTPIWTSPGTWTGLTFEGADGGQFPHRFYQVREP